MTGWTAGSQPCMSGWSGPWSMSLLTDVQMPAASTRPEQLPGAGPGTGSAADGQRGSARSRPGRRPASSRGSARSSSPGRAARQRHAAAPPIRAPRDRPSATPRPGPAVPRTCRSSSWPGHPGQRRAVPASSAPSPWHESHEDAAREGVAGAGRVDGLDPEGRHVALEVVMVHPGAAWPVGHDGEAHTELTERGRCGHGLLDAGDGGDLDEARDEEVGVAERRHDTLPALRGVVHDVEAGVDPGCPSPLEEAGQRHAVRVVEAGQHERRRRRGGSGPPCESRWPRR